MYITRPINNLLVFMPQSLLGKIKISGRCIQLLDNCHFVASAQSQKALLQNSIILLGKVLTLNHTPKMYMAMIKIEGVYNSYFFYLAVN